MAGPAAPTPLATLRGALRALARPRALGVLALAGLVACAVYALRPQVQREFVLARAAPLVDELAIDYLHVTPWSLRLRGVRVAVGGALVQLNELSAGFNPLMLAARTVAVRRLSIRGALDLRGYVPDTTPQPPFPGVLASLAQGYALSLGRAEAKLEIRLPGTHALDAVVAGGGFAPLRTGALDFVLRYAGTAGPGELAVRGRLRAAQLNRGRVTKLDVDAATTVAPGGGAPPQALALALTVTPTRDPEAADDTRPPAAPAPPRPELVQAELAVGGEAHTRLALTGRYRGADGEFAADYRIDTDPELPAQWASPQTLPEIRGKTIGKLNIDTHAGVGRLTLRSLVQVTELARVLGAGRALPAALALEVQASAGFDATHFTLSSLEASVQDTPRFERITATLGDALVIPYAAPLSVLEAPRALATVELGPLPLSWFEGLAGDRRLGGDLTGSYAVLIDDQKRYRLEPRGATRASGIRVEAPGEPGGPPTTVIEGLDIALEPTASWSTDFIRYALNDARITLGERALGGLDLKAASRQGGTGAREWRYRIAGSADVDALRGVPAVAARLADYPLPEGLGVTFSGLVAQRERAVTVERAESLASAPAHPDMLRARGLRPFHLRLRKDGGVTLTNPTGELATLATRGLDLAWLNPLLEGLALGGRVASADFTLSAPEAARLALVAAAPLSVDGFTLAQAGRPLLHELSLRASPTVEYGGEALLARLPDLAVRAGGRALLSGSASLSLAGLAADQTALSTAGTLMLDLATASTQPVLAGLLDRALPEVAFTAAIDFALGVSGGTITTERLLAEVALGERARATFEAVPGLLIRTRLGARENLARAFVGEATLAVRDLPSATVAEFVPLAGLAFAEIDSRLRVRSDGSLLRADTLAPLGVERVTLSGPDGVRIREFSLLCDASLRVRRREVALVLDELALRFAAQPEVPALAGMVRAEFAPGQAVPLSRLTAQVAADLPQLLAQPALLPGHHLARGKLALAVSVDPSRRVAAGILLDDLAAQAPLAVQTFELPLAGELAADGRGFDLSAPLVGRGRSGESRAAVTAHYAPQPDEPRVLRLDVASERFYLNDILATLAAISPQGGGRARAAKRAPVQLDLTPDEKAAWKLIPWAVVIDLHVDRLYYSDYLAFDDVGGHLDLRSRKFALEDIHARFHDAALDFGGAIRFKAGTPQPYALDLAGTLADFDLNQFFTELVPGRKPRIEGLFSGEVKAFGAFPNMQQLRNLVEFDVRLRSRDGLFRPLPPDSSLLGASDMLGLVGEGLSYVPTGGFGAGAVARLVDYIARIDYDTIDIHLLRDARRDVVVEQFQVLSPTIALTATGGIDYVEGIDILDSPLALDASLDMLGRGAAILYSMDLMQDELNPLGYWKGPAFRIWGTPAEPHSNFETIIEQAGDGLLEGSFLRPISGLIGNLKYRWFSSESRQREALQKARRKERAALEEAAADAATAGSEVAPASP